jgi:hypothetical protein
MPLKPPGQVLCPGGSYYKGPGRFGNPDKKPEICIIITTWMKGRQDF